MTPLLKRILTEGLEWADAGGPDHDTFSRSRGLCDTIADYLAVGDYTDCVCGEFEELLLEHFGRDPRYRFTVIPLSYPFGGGDRWELDWANDQMHTNELRLAWVRKVLTDG